MNVYVIGHKGWIGGLFMKQLECNNNVMFSNLRAESDEILHDILQKETTHLLYCAGRTSGGKYNNIDYLEDPSTLKENINDNLYCPVKLALFCEKHSIHFTYIGTGCIYIYDDDHTIVNKKGFNETDKPNFFGSNYSIVKGYTDLLLQNTNTLTLRVRMPITKEEHPRNFVTKLVSFKKINSIMNSMTDLDVMIPIAIDMMKNKVIGTYNFTNIDSNHNEILEKYKAEVNPEHTWELVSNNELDLKAKRSNALLDTTKLKTYLSIDVIGK